MPRDNGGIELADIVGLLSLYFGIKNLVENEQQSDAQIQILRQIDVGSANDRQAEYLIRELGQKFDSQNKILDKILIRLEVLTGEDHQTDGKTDAR